MHWWLMHHQNIQEDFGILSREAESNGTLAPCLEHCSFRVHVSSLGSQLLLQKNHVPMGHQRFTVAVTVCKNKLLINTQSYPMNTIYKWEWRGQLQPYSVLCQVTLQQQWASFSIISNIYQWLVFPAMCGTANNTSCISCWKFWAHWQNVTLGTVNQTIGYCTLS